MSGTESQAQVIKRKAPVRVLHYFAFPGGGIGRYVHELLSRMHTVPSLAVELACIPSYHHLKIASYPVWPKLFDITHRKPLIRRMRFAINLVVNPLRAIRRGEATRAQIIHLSTIPHVTFAIWSRRLRRTGIKLVATAHDVRRSQGLISLNYEVEQLRRLYRLCEAIFVHSEFQKKDLIDFARVPQDKIFIVPHGPYYHGPPQGDKETLRRRYGIPVDKQVALFFGDIRPDKNLDLFLRAMVPFKDRLFLVVAGQPKNRDGKDADYYQKLAKDLTLDGNICWRLEYIPSDEVPNYFEMCDWVALPYSRQFTSLSGVLNVAIAYGRPVLVTKTSTMQTVLRGYEIGVEVAPDDVRAIEDGISRLCGCLLGQTSWEFDAFLKKNSWEVNVAITEKVYCRLLLGQNAPSQYS